MSERLFLRQQRQQKQQLQQQQQLQEIIRPKSSSRPAGAPSSELVSRKINPNSQALLDPIKSIEAVKRSLIKTMHQPVLVQHTVPSVPNQSRSLPKFNTQSNLSVNSAGEDNNLPLVLNQVYNTTKQRRPSKPVQQMSNSPVPRILLTEGNEPKK